VTTKKRTPSKLAAALLETADEMRAADLLDQATHGKITLRHLGPEVEPKVTQMRKLQERANMSQAVFARHPNLTVGYISRLERGTKRPTGAALAAAECHPSKRYGRHSLSATARRPGFGLIAF